MTASTSRRWPRVGRWAAVVAILAMIDPGAVLYAAPVPSASDDKLESLPLETSSDGTGAEIAAVPDLTGTTTVTFGDGDVQPLVPARVLDTRDGTGGQFGPVAANSTIVLQVAGHGGVPAAGAGAVVLNLVSTESTIDTYVTAYPTGVPRPLAANLNVKGGATVPNLVVVKLGVGGTISLYNLAGTTHLVADVQAWFPESASLQPMTPTRLLDTREGNGAPTGAVTPGSVTRLQIAGRAGIPATGVGAVVMNVAVTEPTAPGYLTIYPSGQPRPLAANLNFVTGQTIPNLVVAKVDASGAVDIFNFAGSAHIVADVAGWFPTGSGFTGVTPARLLDTREGNGAPLRPVGPGETIELQVTGRGGIPVTGVGAVVVNVTVTEPTAPSYLTVFPGGVERPLAASLNFVPGQTVPNLVVAGVGPSGTIKLFNQSGTTHLVADVAGWFPAGTAGSTSLVLKSGTVLAGAGDVVSYQGSSTTGGIVVLSGSADIPPVGGYIAVPPTASVPDGLFGKVSGVFPGVGGNKQVVFGPATLDAGFADITTSYKGVIPAGTFDAALASVNATIANTPPRPDGKLTTSAFECKTSPGSTLSPILSLGAGELKFEHDFGLFHKYVKLKIPLEARLGFEAKLTAAQSCTIELPEIPIPVGIAKLGFKARLNVSASGGLTAGASVTASVVFGFEAEGTNVDNLSSFTPTVTGQLDAKQDVSITVRPSIRAELKLFGIAGGYVDIGVDLKGYVAPFATAPTKCAEISLQATIDFGFTADAWVVAWELKLASIKLPKFVFYERQTCEGDPTFPTIPTTSPPNSGPAWTGSVTLTTAKSPRTLTYDWFDGVTRTTQYRNSYSYTLASTGPSLLGRILTEDTDVPPGITVTFHSLDFAVEVIAGGVPVPDPYCYSYRYAGLPTPWAITSRLVRDPSTGVQITDPHDGETIYLLYTAALSLTQECYGAGQNHGASHFHAAFGVGPNDTAANCPAPTVPGKDVFLEVHPAGSALKLCYLPVTVSNGGTRVTFNGQISGSIPDSSSPLEPPVTYTQTISINLNRTG